MNRSLSVIRCPLFGAGALGAAAHGRATDNGRRATDQPRRGFTLIELMIVIMIIAILASLVVGVAAMAAEQGRESTTRNLVARIHTLLMEHYNSFKTRRVELHQDVVDAINTLPAADRGRATAAARLYALREMMLMEVPDRWSDVLLAPVGSTTATDPPPSPVFLAERTALSNAYYRRFLGLLNQSTPDDIKRFQGAECLYMVVMVACGDGEARTLFNESDFGDVDGDGAPEILDGWGQPIDFLRWAPGFNSPIQISANQFGPPESPDLNAWQMAASGDHEPIDLFRVDPRAFRLVPLVYSAGSDEQYSLVVDADPDDAPNFIPWPLTTGVPSVMTAPPYFSPALTPYQINTSILDSYFGSEIGDGGSTDNIHNHLMGQRL